MPYSILSAYELSVLRSIIEQYGVDRVVKAIEALGKPYPIDAPQPVIGDFTDRDDFDAA